MNTLLFCGKVRRVQAELTYLYPPGLSVILVLTADPRLLQACCGSKLDVVGEQRVFSGINAH